MDFETHVERIVQALDDFNDNFECPVKRCQDCKHQRQCHEIIRVREILKNQDGKEQ